MPATAETLDRDYRYATSERTGNSGNDNSTEIIGISREDNNSRVAITGEIKCSKRNVSNSSEASNSREASNNRDTRTFETLLAEVTSTSAAKATTARILATAGTIQ
jgi:hypothetical protein